MRRYFADAFYWIALLSQRDQWHGRVLAFDAVLRGAPLYTTDEVLTEFLAFYSTSDLRSHAAAFVQSILSDARTTVFPQTHIGFLDALALYHA